MTWQHLRRTRLSRYNTLRIRLRSVMEPGLLSPDLSSNCFWERSCPPAKDRLGLSYLSQSDLGDVTRADAASRRVTACATIPLPRAVADWVTVCFPCRIFRVWWHCTLETELSLSDSSATGTAMLSRDGWEGSTARGVGQSYPSICRRSISRSTAALYKRPLKLSREPDLAARGTTTGLSGRTRRCPNRCTQLDSKMTRASSHRTRDSPQQGRHPQNNKVQQHPPRRRRPGRQSRWWAELEEKTSCHRREPTDHLRPVQTKADRAGQALVRERVEC